MLSLTSFHAAIRRDSISLLRFPFFSYFQVFSREIPLNCSFLVSNQLFFLPFLFSGYFCSVDTCIVCIVDGSSDQPSSALFYEIFESY